MNFEEQKQFDDLKNKLDEIQKSYDYTLQRLNDVYNSNKRLGLYEAIYFAFQNYVKLSDEFWKEIKLRMEEAKNLISEDRYLDPRHKDPGYPIDSSENQV